MLAVWGSGMAAALDEAMTGLTVAALDVTIGGGAGGLFDAAARVGVGVGLGAKEGGGVGGVFTTTAGGAGGGGGVAFGLAKSISLVTGACSQSGLGVVIAGPTSPAVRVKI